MVWWSNHRKTLINAISESLKCVIFLDDDIERERKKIYTLFWGRTILIVIEYSRKNRERKRSLVVQRNEHRVYTQRTSCIAALLLLFSISQIKKSNKKRKSKKKKRNLYIPWCLYEAAVVYDTSRQSGCWERARKRKKNTPITGICERQCGWRQSARLHHSTHYHMMNSRSRKT